MIPITSHLTWSIPLFRGYSIGIGTGVYHTIEECSVAYYADGKPYASKKMTGLICAKFICIWKKDYMSAPGRDRKYFTYSLYSK